MTHLEIIEKFYEGDKKQIIKEFNDLIIINKHSINKSTKNELFIEICIRNNFLSWISPLTGLSGAFFKSYNNPISTTIQEESVYRLAYLKGFRDAGKYKSISSSKKYNDDLSKITSWHSSSIKRIGATNFQEAFDSEYEIILNKLIEIID